MERSLFEQMDGTYKQVGDYLLPDIELSDGPNYEIGIWGQRYLRYIKQHHKVLYSNLLTSGKLNIHLAGIDKQAENMFLLIKQMAAREGVTEQLQAENQMEWVCRMNNICNLAM